MQLRRNYRFATGSGLRQLSEAVNAGDADGAVKLLRELSATDGVTWNESPTPAVLREALRAPRARFVHWLNFPGSATLRKSTAANAPMPTCSTHPFATGCSGNSPMNPRSGAGSLSTVRLTAGIMATLGRHFQVVAISPSLIVQRSDFSDIVNRVTNHFGEDSGQLAIPLTQQPPAFSLRYFMRIQLTRFSLLYNYLSACRKRFSGF